MAYERLATALKTATVSCEEFVRFGRQLQGEAKSSSESNKLIKQAEWMKNVLRNLSDMLYLAECNLLAAGRLCKLKEEREECFGLYTQVERGSIAARALQALDSTILQAYFLRPELELEITKLIGYFAALQFSLQSACTYFSGFEEAPTHRGIRLPPHMTAFGPNPYASPDESSATVVKVFFATDRMRDKTRNANVVGFKNCRGSSDLIYGESDVSIPPTHQMGWLERPALYEFRTANNTNRFFLVEKASVTSAEAWATSVSLRLAHLDSNSILVFVHGFNVSFDDALMRTAQISKDLQFEGVTICFSWGSEASSLGYAADMDNADASAPRFAKFLTNLTLSAPDARVHVIAHSMGNRVLVRALQSAEDGQAIRLAEVVMAAPDVDVGHFEDALVVIRRRANRYTLYASTGDLALSLSSFLRRKRYRRIGQGGKHIFVAEGVDTVDGSEAISAFFSLNHSNVFEKQRLLYDLHYVIRTPTPIEERGGLFKRTKRGLPFWLLRK